MSLRATYIYTDDRGRPIFRKRRFEPGRRDSKDFSMEVAKFANETIYWKSGRGCLDRYQPDWKDRALYNLPVLLDALRHGQQVFLCEGERDADCVATMHKAAATTNWQGAKGFTPEQAEWFKRGKSPVHIVIDNDDAGHWAGWQRYSALIAAGVGRKRLRLWLPSGGAGDVTERVSRVGTSRPALASVGPGVVKRRAFAVGAETAGRTYWRSAS